MSGAVAAMLDDGRLHLQHGPIDLIIEAFGSQSEVKLGYEQAWGRFKTVLEELVGELALLRSPLDCQNTQELQGAIARTMVRAVRPLSSAFVTPMAAVAGAVADEVLASMLCGRKLSKAYVNNGGDIAVHLAPGNQFDVGLVANPVAGNLVGAARLLAEMAIGGIATSGCQGRSQSLGIADAVTVLAATAAQADAAATMLANAVDLPGHPAISRSRANSQHPDSDLGNRLVTVDVGVLSSDEVDVALGKGASAANDMLNMELIDAAVFCLHGEIKVCQGATHAGVIDCPGHDVSTGGDLL
jgi:ApbE superfamily uncharacterized protein (UPF0280 family)